MLPNLPYKLLLLIGVLIIVFACNRKPSSKQTKTTAKTTSVGKVVTVIDPSIWVIYQDKKANFWFGSKENGVFRYNGQQITQFTKDDGLWGNQIRGIKEDAVGTLFFETTSGINSFDGVTLKSLTVKSKDSTASQWKLEPNDLWFSAGYHNNGAYRYDGKELHFLEFPKSPQEANFTSKYPNASHNPYGVYSIFKDRNGNLWFGTSDMGMYRFDGKTISYLYEKQLTETPSGGAFGIRSIAEDEKGYFWICNADYKYKMLPTNTESTALIPIQYERQQGVKNTEKETEYFLSILADNHKNLWMLSFESGVWKNDGHALTHYPLVDDGSAVKPFSMYKDNQGVLWVGTQSSGVFKFNGTSFEKVNL